MSLKSTLKNLVDKIFENWDVKLISFLIALGLWFYIKSLNANEYEIYIPVYYANMPSNYVIVNSNDLPKYVLLKVNSVRKNSFDITKIKNEDIIAIVDLSKGSKDGKYKITLSKPLPSNSVSYSLVPSEIFIDLDTITNTIIKVIPNNENYISIPSSVIVYFPSRMSNQIKDVYVSAQSNNKGLTEIQLPSNDFIKYEPSKIYLSNTNN